MSSIRTLHVPFTFHPDPCGGTEVYVTALCRELQHCNVTNIIAAPSTHDQTYQHHGFDVHRFAITPGFHSLEDSGDPLAAERFGAILDHTRPNLVHFHAYSPAISVRALAEAKKRGIATIYTYHTPTGSCLRGTLMRWGSIVCDGRLQTGRCASCYLHGLGIPRLPALALSVTSILSSAFARLLPKSVKWQIPARARELTALRHQQIRQWWSGMDHIIVLCEWSRKLLIDNGVPPEKLSLIRHGLSYPTNTPPVQTPPPAKSSKIIFKFLGRLHPTKGLHLLLDAMERIPELHASFQLEIHAILPDQPDDYTAGILKRIESLPCCTLMPSLPSEEVIPTLRQASALLVPSTGMETGPLVVLEAFAAGIPVVATKLGGMAERITPGVDGLMLDDNCPQTWAGVLKKLILSSRELHRLKAGVKPPPSMADTASKTLEIYQRLIGNASITHTCPQ